MIRNFLIVALGGALGSTLRWACTLGVAHWQWRPLIATLIVNIAGSFLIGVFYGASTKMRTNLFLSTGLCGGFTTFSTFSLQNVQLLQQGQYGMALVNMGITLALCLLACIGGIMIGKLFA